MVGAAARPRCEGSRSVVGLALVLGIAGCVLRSSVALAAAPPPWQRTETREPCASFDTLRNPYFGDTHVHTAYSFDAVLANTLTTPREAYRFAKGEAIGLPPFDSQGNPRPHASSAGRSTSRPSPTTPRGSGAQICLRPGLSGYDSSSCRLLRQASVSNDPTLVQQVFFAFLVAVITSVAPTLPEAVREAPGYADCRPPVARLAGHPGGGRGGLRPHRGVHVHHLRRLRVERRTPNGNNLHRNVIFRNDACRRCRSSYIEQQTPQGLWAALRGAVPRRPRRAATCSPSRTTPNISGGAACSAPRTPTAAPLDAAEAAPRAAWSRWSR